MMGKNFDSSSDLLPEPEVRNNKPRKRCTPLSLCLVVMLLVVLAGACALAAVLATTTKEKVDENGNSINGYCKKKECILGAVQVIQAMDPNVDPCDDFYQYACGGWLSSHTLPDDASRYGTFTKLRRDLQVELKALLEKKNDTKEDNLDAVRKAKDLYSSCMDEEKIRKAGLDPLKKILADFGGWPMTGSWDHSKYDLVKLMIQLRLHNTELLFSWGVTVDDKEPENHIIYLDQEYLGMPSRDYYLKGRNDKVLRVYEEMGVNAAKMLGASDSVAKKDMSDVIDFEIKLAKSTASKAYRRDINVLYHKMAVEEFQSLFPDLPFKLIDLLQGYFAYDGITINKSTNILIYQLSYFESLAAILQSTDRRVITNYVISRFVRERIPNLPEEYRSLGDAYKKAISGYEVIPARWKECVSYVNADSTFGDVTGRLFVEKYFNTKAQTEAKNLIADLRSSFKKKLSSSDWMDSETGVYAKEKLKAIEERIAFDNRILNSAYIEQKNADWLIQEEHYFNNVLNVLKTRAIRNMKLLLKPVDWTKWASTPAVVNAFYDPSKNSITFPAGILQPPFYGQNYPYSMNYGGIGVVIGHEMSHGFDDQGRAYDKHGQLRQWWSKSSLEKFKKRAECLVDQYSRFSINGDHIRGKVTLGENIADNGGMKIAYQAYEEHVEEFGEEAPLPGMNLTHRQLVFISFAQAFCSKTTSQYIHRQITTNEHSPARYRIIGTLSNNEDFAKQYHCKKGSPMNPEKKCAVW